MDILKNYVYLDLCLNKSNRMVKAHKRLAYCLSDCVDALGPSQQFFSHIGTLSCLAGLD